MKAHLRLRQLLGILSLAIVANTAAAQSVLFITNGDASSLQAIDTNTGTIVYSVTSTPLAYPVAVRDTIWLGHRDNGTNAVEYSISNGAPTGNTAPLAGSDLGEFVDGAVNGSVNYTLNAFTSVAQVYSANTNWTNPTPIFSVNGGDVVGITYDIVNNTLWISDSSKIGQYTLTGTLLSQFNHAGNRGSLAYQASTDTLWYVPNSTGMALLQYSKSGELLRSLSVAGRSGNVWGAEFAAIPEPSTFALLAAGLGVCGWRLSRRRRHPGAR